MLQVDSLSKSFGSHLLFEKISFHINPGDKIAVVGRNGQGKTTLFKILTHQELPEEGQVTTTKNYQIGILTQQIRFTESTVLKEASLGLNALEREQTWQAEKLLSGLGFSNQDFQKNPRLFSGGFQLRINLIKTLLAKPNLLLLDEPTNYLDIVSIRWLKKLLQQWPGEIMCISHDRYFLDFFSSHTLGFHNNTARKMKGTTKDFLGQISIENQVHEQTRLNEERKRKQSEKFINQFRAKARMAGMVQSRIKALNKKEVLNKKKMLKNLNFEFIYQKIEAKNLIHLHNIYFGYSQKKNLIEKLSLDINKKSRIGIIGKNGKGKSTLLNIIAKNLGSPKRKNQNSQ